MIGAVVDFIGERLALPLVVVISCSGLWLVPILGARWNREMLDDYREAVRGEEVKTMNLNRAALALALCAGCAVGDPGGGSSLLPGSDGATGMRAPAPVEDAGPVDTLAADALAPLVDAAPTLAVDASPVLADAAPAAADALPAVCAGGLPKICQGNGGQRAVDCGRYLSPPGLFDPQQTGTCGVVTDFVPGGICYASGLVLRVNDCRDCALCGWAVAP